MQPWEGWFESWAVKVAPPKFAWCRLVATVVKKVRVSLALWLDHMLGFGACELAAALVRLWCLLCRMA